MHKGFTTITARCDECGAEVGGQALYGHTKICQPYLDRRTMEQMEADMHEPGN